MDASPGGIGLGIDAALQVGSQFMVGFRRAGQRATVILYEVRHCRPFTSGQSYVVGAALVRTLRESELLAASGIDSPLHRLGRLLLDDVAEKRDAPWHRADALMSLGERG